MASSVRKVSLLPRDIGSLSRTVPPGLPGTLHVLGANGGMSVAPDADFTLLFGRNEPDVHVSVGAGDTRVSRRQGLIVRESSRWVLYNTGGPPIRFPGSRLVLGGDHARLNAGFTPLFVVSSRQEHLLEVRITASTQGRPANAPGAYEEETRNEARELTPEERLVLVCLAQRYLRLEPGPQPLAWAQVAFELAELQPQRQWSPKAAAHVVAKVRKRLSKEYGVAGLLEEEVPQPVGNALNHNLITDLLITTTIVRSDLRLLGE
ncbi:hypothetical protein ACM01_12980 [Streptomyces viridochromogenes]|uniref:FHA domain-containing protein n=1 Tax=Streptomyces viridochromogenes TaxID=1938 RepID=A0A0J7ZG23_STRVR|nr:hypothetical protein [Streptomyces viridochromogenes]KMS74829.1 hypothetical protein ACM01_12980 [Streptomyces viridochromogenes]KOG14888.1 hypothetical protein ADK36_30530 [Streptomyces viridochromogenes]KOG15082.1 hypothetical protein ADK35_30175 [Streptomyces viridochromogenes]